jgi:hypothetical protein
MLTTRLNKPWVVKIVLFAAVLVFFGFYGLYDALVAYPARGLRYASYAQFQYLDAAKSNSQLTKVHVSVDDPAAELSKLRALDRARYAPLDAPRRDWLEALAMVGRLKPDQTRIDDPAKKLDELRTAWTTSGGGALSAPKPLSLFDISVQWVYVVVGLGGGFCLLMLYISVARQSYRWEAQTQTLHMPDGNTLTPTDVEDFDKRKWDKFLVFVKVKPTHATLGGQELKLDLYRYTPLEEWVLAMERTAFPDRAEPVKAEVPAPEPSAANGSGADSQS